MRKQCNILIFSLTLGMMLLSAQGWNSFAQAPAEGGADNGRKLFAHGNEAYITGNYDEAILYYQKAMDLDGYAPSLLYNLGNARYMKKAYGQAILNYERALYLDPGNTDIKANLAQAMKSAGLTMPSHPFWKTFFTRVTLNGWTWMAVIAFCTFSLMLLANGIRPGMLGRPLPKMLVSACCLFFLMAGGGIWAQYRNLDRGVVTGENARIRVSPFDSANDSGAVKSGNVVQIADTYEGYVLVKEANGKSGWISKNEVQAILPLNNEHQSRTSLTRSTLQKMNEGDATSETNKS